MLAIGQTLLVGSFDGVRFYSPWFLREGNAATMTVEIIAMSGSVSPTATLTVRVQTKNSEDADPAQGGGLASGTHTLTANALGVESGRSHSYKELIRFEYAVTGSAGGWVHFRMLSPAWELN